MNTEQIRKYTWHRKWGHLIGGYALAYKFKVSRHIHRHSAVF